jgi:hypothetical protein
MGKYTPVTSVVIQFSQNELHRLASGDIDVLQLYLTADSDQLATDPIDIIRRGTQQLLLEACAHTGDLTRLPMLVEQMTFSWRAKNGTLRNIRTPDHLNRALEYCIANNTFELIIQCNTDLLFFDTAFTGVDLDQVDTTPILSTPVVHVTPPVMTSTTTAPSVTSPTDVFNYHALPADVLHRFDAFQDPTTILRVQDMSPFLSPDGSRQNFYTNPFVIGSRVILRNGAVLEAKRDQKQFSRDLPICSDDTPSKLRTWYRNFAHHALACGYFVVPYELLSKHHGGSTGFEFGIDLPQAKITEYFHWQCDIGNVLQRPGIFPSRSQASKRVTTSHNGYEILLALVSDSHPGYVDQPIVLAMHFPKQEHTQDIFAFYNTFMDTIRLRAIFMGGNDDMSSPHMVDCFIQSCSQAKYLTQVSRFDRQDPTKRHLFQAGALAITLTNYLANSDSPLKPHAPLAATPPHNANKNRNPYHRHIRSMISESAPDTDTTPTLTDTQLDHHHELVVRELRSRDPGEAPICALCKTESHRFKECPLLNDSTFLRGFAIRMCTTLSKEIRTGKHRLANPTESQINAIEAHIHAVLEDSSTSSPPTSSTDTVFPTGEI